MGRLTQAIQALVKRAKAIGRVLVQVKKGKPKTSSTVCFWCRQEGAPAAIEEKQVTGNQPLPMGMGG